MELTALIDALARPDAYPHPVEMVQVQQTHVSVVFLAGAYAYKVKKPVGLGFLDFRTPEQRRHFCGEEIRLNRRLAPAVYLGAVPVTCSGQAIRMEGDGEVIDWAVKMRRLPEAATLKARLRSRSVGVGPIESLARKIARFHARAEAGGHVASFGRFEVVAGNARENFSQSWAHLGSAVSPGVFARLKTLTDVRLDHLRPLIQPRDTHGDLHLDHVYLFPDNEPPDDLVIIDCIEFNERFRYADPVADMAFLVMDLAFHGRRDLAEAFATAYFQASGDQEGRGLLPFYTAYRAAVRAKVEGFELVATEMAEPDRAAALVQARAHWLLALGELEGPGRRPCLVLVGGLPGTGKSTLARGLAERAGFSVIRSDVVRQELAGASGSSRVPSPFGEGLYSPEWTGRTYAECLRRAEALLFAGGRVIIDATFREERARQRFLEAAAGWGVPGLVLLCQAGPARVRTRLGSRRDDASDADWSVHVQLAQRWEEPGPVTRPCVRDVSTAGSREQTLSRAVEALRESRLSGPA